MTSPIDRLDASLVAFMRYFLVHINPILHRTTYRGRTYSEYEIIVVMAIAVVGPVRPVDLSRGLSIEKATLTSVIRRLRELGLLVRREVPGDERSYRVALTSAGRALRRHLDRQRQTAMRTLFAGMPAADIAAVARGFDLLSAYLQRVEEEHVGMGAASAG